MQIAADDELIVRVQSAQERAQRVNVGLPKRGAGGVEGRFGAGVDLGVDARLAALQPEPMAIAAGVFHERFEEPPRRPGEIPQHARRLAKRLQHQRDVDPLPAWRKQLAAGAIDAANVQRRTQVHIIINIGIRRNRVDHDPLLLKCLFPKVYESCAKKSTPGGASSARCVAFFAKACYTCSIKEKGGFPVKDFFCRLFTPWKAGAQFDAPEAFYGFLLGRDKLLGTIRNLCFAAALVLLVIGYAVSDGTGGYSIADIANQPYYLIAVSVMVLALLLSLVMIRIEKELPKEMRPK